MHRYLFAAMVVLSLGGFSRAADRLVVHEWGTFTSLQDEQGNAIGGINTDDEPVPGFVHQVIPGLLFPPTLAASPGSKAAPEGDPDVTMRLETPVLYFHLPKGQSEPVKVDVDVAFRGGWLTQYFPDARASVDSPTTRAGTSLDVNLLRLGERLTAKTVGRLSWRGLTLNSEQGQMPLTADRVWTSPRAVDSTAVAEGAEREQFLFYRGVGHVDSPLRVMREADGNVLTVHDAAAGLAMGNIWLVDIRADGSTAFRSVAGVTPTVDATATEFSEGDYSRENRGRLREAMRESLVEDGLFGDEADALLNTWGRSYFQNPGERLFFLVPQAWTDAVLPLGLSIDADVKRVMVGRVELVTPAQRGILKRMALWSSLKSTDLKAVTAAMTRLQNDPAKREAYDALAGGHGNLADLGVPVPWVYANYLALGRFRTPLLRNEISKSSALLSLSTQLTP